MAIRLFPGNSPIVLGIFFYYSGNNFLKPRYVYLVGVVHIQNYTTLYSFLSSSAISRNAHAPKSKPLEADEVCVDTDAISCFTLSKLLVGGEVGREREGGTLRNIMD